MYRIDVKIKRKMRSGKVGYKIHEEALKRKMELAQLAKAAGRKVPTMKIVQY